MISQNFEHASGTIAPTLQRHAQTIASFSQVIGVGDSLVNAALFDHRYDFLKSAIAPKVSATRLDRICHDQRLRRLAD